MPYNQFRKITDLPTITSGQVDNSTDLLAIVDVSDERTKSTTLNNFILSTLDGGTFIGSFSGSFQGDGSGITGILGGWDGSHLGNSSITGSFTVSGSGTSVNFIEVENGTSGSFFGTFSGSFYGDGSGLTGLTADTASYVTSSNVDGPHGMNSILSASHAVNTPTALSSSTSINSSYALSSSTSANSSYTLSSSYALTASYSPGGNSFWVYDNPNYYTVNDLQSTGSLFASDLSAADLTVNESMSVGGQLRNSGRLAYEQGPRLLGPENILGANINIDYLNLDKGGWKSTNFGIPQSGSVNYLYGGLGSGISNHNEKDPSPYTGSENIGQSFKIWFGPNSNTSQNNWANSQFKLRVASNNWALNDLGPSSTSKVITCLTPLSGSESGLNNSTGIGSVCEIYQVGDNEYFGVATGPFTI